MAGEGSIEQVLRLLGWIDADPWIKRIIQFRLNPNADGTRIKVNLKLTTLFLPGRTPEDPPAPGELDLARINGLVALNPFRIPPPPAPPEVKPEPTPEPAPVVAQKPPPVGFPYENWVLTGVAVGPDGPEAWLRNTQNTKRRTMRPGGSIGDAVLVDIEGEIARFTLGDETLKVRIGRSLATGRDTSL